MGTKDFTVNPEVMSGNVDTPIIYRNATTQDDNEEEYETKQKGGYTDSKVILEDLIKLKSKLKDMKKSVKTKYR
jgi:hypothetical protein